MLVLLNSIYGPSLSGNVRQAADYLVCNYRGQKHSDSPSLQEKSKVYFSDTETHMYYFAPPLCPLESTTAAKVAVWVPALL